MAFESIAYIHSYSFDDYPRRWLPLTYFYDADLPLFPISYFHVLDPAVPASERPREDQRAYGFITHLRLSEDGCVVDVATNKDLAKSTNLDLSKKVETEIRSRLGLENPVRLADIAGELRAPLDSGNDVVRELWHKVVDPAFGGVLPFGETWDKVFGLARWIASWNSDGGRKGELIQLHAYAGEFGERVPTSDVVHSDFYLFPTWEEFRDSSNPLHHFPRFRDLTEASGAFVGEFCEQVPIGTSEFSSFQRSRFPGTGRLSNESIRTWLDGINGVEREIFASNWGAFNRGPQRSVISLLMHHDLRHSAWDPASIDAEMCGQLYTELRGSYQSPKVIALYSQLCAGNSEVLPIDSWVEAFLAHPLSFDWAKFGYTELFSTSSAWGKLERLVWQCVQARKVHSSVCEGILWCIRYGDTDKKLRGGNPLACKICSRDIRDVCPVYDGISATKVVFNVDLATDPSAQFSIITSAGNSTSPNQQLIAAKSKSCSDIYSTKDRPGEFGVYPAAGHKGESLSVEDFVSKY
jgi:hypothetical protein